jgi:hypothetical protein
MPDEPSPIVRNANADVWELIQALVVGRLPSDKILELFYLAQRPGVLELVRAILDLRPEDSTTIAAFLSVANPNSVSVEFNGSGKLTISSPMVTNAAMKLKAAELITVESEQHDDEKRPRNIQSA